MNLYKEQVQEFLNTIKTKSDRLINYFLAAYFTGGIICGYFYDTWNIAVTVGSLCLVAYYSTKLLLPNSNAYQYVLSGILGIFMAQYIYQMHGMFEMHFIAFIGSAILITYQNWKLQIPLVLVVVIHHAIFGYLQYLGFQEIYFTKLEYMDLETFIIHVILAAVIFFTCGLWAHHFKKYSERQIEQTFEMGRLQEDKEKTEALIQTGENLKFTIDKLNEAQQIAHLGSWERNIGNDVVFWSDEIYRIFELEKGTVVRYSDCLDWVHPDDIQTIKEVGTNALINCQPYNYECRIITSTGKLKYVFVKGTVQVDDANRVYKTSGILQDITERKEAIEALRKSEDQFRSLFENARDPILLLDDTQKFIDCNQATVKILGATSKEQILFKSPGEFSPEFQSDGQLSFEKSKQMDRNAFFEGSTQFEWLHQRLDGSVFPVDVSLTKIPRGNKNILLVHWRDISEQKQANETLAHQNAELIKTNSELDRFVYSVSHDLRAPLSSMLGVIEISQEETTDELLLEHFRMLESSIKKLDGFIGDILNYSRNSRLEITNQKINLKELILDITSNLKYMESNNHRKVTVNMDIPPDATVCSDRSRLYIILNNLISNAIRYQNPHVEKPLVNVKIDLSDTETNIVVKDNGIGIKKENQQKIFDMFYRVSESSVGSGLGLYIVKEIVDKLEGRIELESNPGVGTAFKIALPINKLINTSSNDKNNDVQICNDNR